MRRLVQTGFNVIKTSTDANNLQMFVRFNMPEQFKYEDIQEIHEFLESLCGQTQGMNYQRVDSGSYIVKPANLNIPRRSLHFFFRGVFTKKITLSICTRVWICEFVIYSIVYTKLILRVFLR